MTNNTLLNSSCIVLMHILKVSEESHHRRSHCTNKLIVKLKIWKHALGLIIYKYIHKTLEVENQNKLHIPTRQEKQSMCHS